MITSSSSIAVDSGGNAYITGGVSGNLPVTAGAFQTTSPFPAYGVQATAFVSKLNPSGSALVYSTYLYGSSPQPSAGNGIAVDSLGSVSVAGQFRAISSTYPSTGDFLLTPDAFQNSYSKVSGDFSDAFLTKLSPDGSTLVYSTYFGGTGDDVAAAVAIDQVGDAYIAGHTSSLDLPVTSHAFQPSMHGTGDAFVTKFPLSSNQTLTLSAITPPVGGNSGPVTPQIAGTGFHAGAAAQLKCGGAIVGTNTTVGVAGRLLDTTFDLTASLPGTCDVVVTNPDGNSATLPQAFTVQQGGASNIQVYLTGVVARKVPPEVQLGPANIALFVTLSNTGSVDAADGLVGLPLNPGYTQTSTNAPFIHDQLSAPASWVEPVTQRATSTSAALTIPPSGIWYLYGLHSHQSAVLTSTASTVTSTAVCSAIWGPVCFTQNLAATVACISQDAQSTANCAAASVGCAAATGCLVANLPGLCSTLVGQCIGTAKRCLGDPLVQDCIKQNASACTSSVVPCIVPADPNNMVGPAGIGKQGWIAGTQGLSYGVSFNNEPTATAPAQQVIVTQPLGPNVNLSTLTLPMITVPNNGNDVHVPVSSLLFSPAANVNEFTTTVDLRPAQNLLVAVDALLNPTAQTLTWTLTSIDPATGQPPLNPLIGFLPPGAGASVSFSVVPRAGLTTGSQVVEQASVVFDGQSPVLTQPWLNTIDNNSPVSHVLGLPSAESCSNFKVQWSGSDIGAGTKGYTIYASDNGAAFAPWLTNTNFTSLVYQGQVGHSYRFYSIASDLVGNVEPTKTAAEATTTVASGTSCGPPSLSGAASVVSYVNNTLSLNLQLTDIGTSDALNTLVKTLSFRTLGGTGTVTLASPTLPFIFGTVSVDNTITIPVTLNVPSTVTKFSMTEGGTMQDGSGKTYNFSIGENVVP